MRKLNKIIVGALLAFPLFSINAIAQTGLIGKRLLIKTDVINGLNIPFSEIEADYAISRKVVFSLGFSSILKSPVWSTFNADDFVYWTQNVSPEYWNDLMGHLEPLYVVESSNKYYFLNGLKKFDEESFKGKIKARNNMVDFAIKFFRGDALSAPFGGYTELGFNYGNVILSGSFDMPVVDKITKVGGDDVYTFRSHHVELDKIKIDFMRFYAGGGKQFFLNKRWMMDINGGVGLNLTGTRGDKIENLNKSVFSSLIAPNIGNNVVSKVIRSDKELYNQMNVGLFFKVKIGYLLY